MSTYQQKLSLPNSYAFAIAPGTTNVCEVTITARDSTGTTIPAARNFMWWLSDAASGLGLTATAASGAVAAKASSGSDLTALTAKKHTIAQTKADGSYILSITDTSKTGFYVAVAGFNGIPAVGDGRLRLEKENSMDEDEDYKAPGPHRWKKGESGNPAGKPKGTRNLLGHAMILNLIKVWARCGEAGFRALLVKDPAEFARISALLIPKRVRRMLDELHAEQVDERIAELQERLGIRVQRDS